MNNKQPHTFHSSRIKHNYYLVRWLMACLMCCEKQYICLGYVISCYGNTMGDLGLYLHSCRPSPRPSIDNRLLLCACMWLSNGSVCLLVSVCACQSAIDFLGSYKEFDHLGSFLSTQSKNAKLTAFLCFIDGRALSNSLQKLLVKNSNLIIYRKPNDVTR